MTGLSLKPIETADVPQVARFLHDNQGSKLTEEGWRRLVSHQWVDDPPNHGFALWDDGAVVGAYLATYSDRTIDGSVVRFCDLGTWNVVPDHRMHSVRLVRALLAQDGYHFTDLSPSQVVARVNTRLGFESLDTTMAVVPNVPWPKRGANVSGDPDEIASRLDGNDRQIYEDHLQTGVRMALLYGDGETCLVLYRRSRIRRVPVVETFHLTNPDLYLRMMRTVAGYHLAHDRSLFTMVELRLLNVSPHGVLRRRFESIRRMYKSPSLAPDRIDYLYSELMWV